MTQGRALRGLLPALAFAAVSALVAFGSPAQAQGADPVTLTDIAIESGGVTYRIPRLDIRGGNLTEAEARALFDVSSSTPVAERLARVSAQEIAIPQVTIEQPLGGGRHTTTYRDIVLSGLSAGRVAQVAGGGGTFDSIGIDKGGRGSFGRLAASDVDVVQSLTIASEKAGPAPAEYRRLYASLSLDALEASNPDGTGFRIGRIAARDFKARPTAESWTETIRLLGDLGEKGKLAEDQQARALGLTADLFDAIDPGSIEVVDFETRGQKPSEPYVRITRMSYAGAESGRGAEARMEGFETTGPDATARIASIAFTDFSFKPTIAGLKEFRDRPLSGIDPGDYRKLVPAIGTIRMSGLDFDVPAEPKGPGRPKGPPMRVGLRSLELAAERPVNGIPTNLRLSLDNLAFPIAADSQEDVTRELADMGYRAVDLSTRLAAVWTESAGELALREFSLRGADMGSLAVRGTFGNVGRDLFDPDSAIAGVALVGATLKSVEINVENGGLAEKYLRQQAALQKRPGEDLRREYGMTAAVGIPALLGNSAQAKALGSAVARFIAKPNRLAITARARDGNGLGAADMALLGDPNALMGKIDLSAKAE